MTVLTDPTVVNTIAGGVVALLLALVGILADHLRRTRKDHGGKLDEVHDQVKNSHTTNLRHDIDGLAADIRLILNNQNIDRRDRQLLAARFDAHIQNHDK